MKFFDKIASEYDAAFSAPCYKDESRALVSLCCSMPKPILDVGCGTGLFLDYSPVFPDEYVGLDPSSGMLIEFARKHRGYRLVCDFFRAEKVSDDIRSIIALFSVPNYIEFSQIKKLSKLTQRQFLVFDAPGYFQRTFEIFGEVPEHYKTDIAFLKSCGYSLEPFSSYILARK